MKTLLMMAALGAAMPATAQVSASLAPAAAPVDPAQLTLARSIVLKIAPDGTYRKLMQGSMDQVIGSMTTQMMNVPIRQFVAAAGLPEADVAKLGNTSLRDIMAILDPAFDQRMHITMTATMATMTDVLTSFEPQLREGLAEAYARNFTPAQLADIARFFNSPAGAAYASRLMTIMADPAVRSKMEALLPAIMQAMPKVMQQVQAQTASLPKPKKPEDLTDADRARLAQLLGVDPATLKKGKAQ